MYSTVAECNIILHLEKRTQNFLETPSCYGKFILCQFSFILIPLMPVFLRIYTYLRKINKPFSYGMKVGEKRTPRKPTKHHANF